MMPTSCHPRELAKWGAGGDVAGDLMAHADAEGTGILSLSEVRSCLEDCELNLSASEVYALLSLLSDDTPYADLASLAFKILHSIATNKK